MIARCAYCHGGQVLQIGEAFALRIAEDWIDAYRCNQYVLCPCVVGLVVRRSPQQAREAAKLEQLPQFPGSADAAQWQAGAAVPEEGDW